MVVGLLEMLTKKRSQVFCKPVDVHSVKNAIGVNISSVSIWNIANQLGKYDFSGGLVVNRLQLFSDQINRNRRGLILARGYRNCSTIENQRYLNSAVNETIY